MYIRPGSWVAPSTGQCRYVELQQGSVNRGIVEVEEYNREGKQIENREFKQTCKLNTPDVLNRLNIRKLVEINTCWQFNINSRSTLCAFRAFRETGIFFFNHICKLYIS